MEAEERKRLSDLYLFIVEFVKSIRRTQQVTSAAMLFLHKFFKRNSLINTHPSFPSCTPYVIATACVFLSAKVCYLPITLKSVAHAYFDIEKRKYP